MQALNKNIANSNISIVSIVALQLFYCHWNTTGHQRISNSVSAGVHPYSNLVAMEQREEDGCSVNKPNEVPMEKQVEECCPASKSKNGFGAGGGGPWYFSRGSQQYRPIPHLIKQSISS